MPRQMLKGPFQILHTDASVVILFEYMHASRDIHLNRTTHLPARIRTWQGDAIGKWDGDTFVVDTQNLNGKSWVDAQGNFTSASVRIAERFSMVDGNTINYEVKLEDPSAFSSPWTMAYPLEREQEPNFELLEEACHEAPREGATEAGPAQ
jgi:hypothetical protein